MRRNRLYLAWMAAALLTMAGCSDEIGNNVQQGKPIEGDGVYMKVNIMTPASSGAFTKAGGENDDPTGGEEGDGSLTALEEENYVRSATLVLYKVEGATNINDADINTANTTVVASSYTELILDQNAGSTDYTNHDYKATARINSELLETGVTYRVLAIVNANVADQFTAGESLADCKMKTYNQHQIGTINERGRFIMSTHAEEMDGEGSIVTFTGEETTADNAASTTVWVERLSARIDYTGTTFNFEVKSTEQGQDQQDQKVIANVQLSGVAAINLAKHPMYIFKQVTQDTNINGAIITLGDELPNPNTSYTHKEGENYVIEPTTSHTYNKQFDNEFKAGFVNDLTFTDFSAAHWSEEASTTDTEKDRIIAYTGENTMGVDAQLHGYTTGVVFKAIYNPVELIVWDETTGTANPKEGDYTNKGFYKVGDKIYADLAAAEADYIATETEATSTDPLVQLRLNFTKDEWTSFNVVSIDDLKKALERIKDVADLGYISFLRDKLETASTLSAETMNWDAFMGNKNIPKNNTESNQVINKDDDHLQTINYYGTDHVCYYQYWIRHANNGDPDKMGIMEFCIVRNNVYRLNVTNINGLGMPDPFDSTESPDEGEEEGLYLTVQLYVKNWVVRLNDNIILQ
ncbi:Mfa1 family fimbria major subunit [Parabacteroides sp.]